MSSETRASELFGVLGLRSWVTGHSWVVRLLVIRWFSFNPFGLPLFL
jgi:hypothetical protein